MRRVLLLNPPSDRPLVRDYYCSKTSKSGYLYQPIDLLMQSAWLGQRFELGAIDAVAEGLDPRACTRRVGAFRPDAIVALAAAAHWRQDLAYLGDLKRDLGGPALLLSGDLFLEDAESWLEGHPDLDGILLDFTNDDAGRILRGEDGEVENAVWRREGGLRSARSPRSRGGEFEMPVPRHDLFQGRGYRFSFSRRRRFATVLSDFGCPYPCGFCVMPGLGHKLRGLGGVLEELRAIHALGLRELFFADQTFGARRERSLELCRLMVAEGFGFGWTAFTRADLVQEPVLKAWRDAGCHTLIFGVESADAGILKAWQKPGAGGATEGALRLAQDLGIRTVGTFLLGLPEDKAESVEATIQLACKLPLDYASLNVAVPRCGTALRQRALELGLCQDPRGMDQEGSEPAMPTLQLSQGQLKALRRRFILKFYLRPAWLLRRLLAVRNPWELFSQVREALGLFTRA